MTGLSRQLFDDAVAAVHRGEKRVAVSKGNITKSFSKAEGTCLAFLDSFFRGYRVQYDPAGENKVMNHKNWKRLYEEDYIPHCEASEAKPLSYVRFCQLRSSERPHFQICKTFRRKSKYWCFVKYFM